MRAPEAIKLDCDSDLPQGNVVESLHQWFKLVDFRNPNPLVYNL